MLDKYPRLLASFLCSLAGFVAAWGFAPTELWWLMPICLAALIYFWCNASPKQAVLYGYCFGLGLYLHGIVWIVTLAHDFNGAAYWLAWFIHLIIALILASYIAVVGYLQAKLLQNQSFAQAFSQKALNSSPNVAEQLKLKPQSLFWQRALLVSALWVLADWLRSNVLSNFPWLEIAYSQTGFALSAYATLGGASMVSFVLLLCAFCLVNVLTHLRVNCVKQSLTGLIVLILLFGVGAGLQTVNWSRAIDQPFTTALVQANIPIQQKWQEQALDRVVRTYYRQTKGLDVDLAIWPETAIPTRLQRVDEAFWHKVAPASGELISGVEQVIDETTYNAAIMTCRGQRQIYQKQRLVPFGEYIPFRFLTQFIAHYIGLEVHQYGRAEQSMVFDCDSLTTIGLSICFEIAFPRLIRQQALQSQVLVNISEDAWFGDSTATFQRLQMARMRAIEFSRPMLASSNSGPSAIVNHHGRVVTMSGNYVQQTVQGRVFPQQGMTPFLRWGDWFVALCLIACLIYLLRAILTPNNRAISRDLNA